MQNHTIREELEVQDILRWVSKAMLGGTCRQNEPGSNSKMTPPEKNQHVPTTWKTVTKMTRELNIGITHKLQSTQGIYYKRKKTNIYYVSFTFCKTDNCVSTTS